MCHLLTEYYLKLIQITNSEKKNSWNQNSSYNFRENDLTEKEIEEESFTGDPISSHYIVCFTYEINISVNDGKVNVYINFFFSISCENVLPLSSFSDTKKNYSM